MDPPPFTPPPLVVALYNNAGVQMLEQWKLSATLDNGTQQPPLTHLEIAIDLFQGALQVQLESERGGEVLLHQSRRSVDLNEESEEASRVSSSPMASVAESLHESLIPMEQQQQQQQQQPASFVALAEWHVQRLPTYLNGDYVYNVPQDNRASSSLTVTTVVPVEHRGSFVPYLCQEAMFIASYVLNVGDESSQQLIMGSIIVYNLALVHQLRHRNCAQAASLYELSASLLQTVSAAPPVLLHVTWPLRLALLNNFGVWCYDNGDGECMLTCMEYLRVALDTSHCRNEAKSPRENNTTEAGDAVTMDDVERGMRTNIDRILTPRHGSSPAA
jgi:hypothetical protein